MSDAPRPCTMAHAKCLYRQGVPAVMAASYLIRYERYLQRSLDRRITAGRMLRNPERIARIDALLAEHGSWAGIITSYRGGGEHVHA